MRIGVKLLPGAQVRRVASHAVGLRAMKSHATSPLKIERAGIVFDLIEPHIGSLQNVMLVHAVVRRLPRACVRSVSANAARAAIDFAFGPANLTHLISMIREDNARSRRVAEKLGLSVERTLPLKDGDTQVYGIRRATQPTSDLIARSMRPGIAHLQGIRSAGK